MPRQIDLTPQNLKVSNDPTNQIGATPDQIGNYLAEIPQLILQALEQAVQQILQEIDNLTGLNLVGFAQDLGKIFSGNLLGGLLGMVTGNNSDILALIEGVGGTAIGDVVGVIKTIESFVNGLIVRVEQFFGAVPVGALTNTQPNLLPAPTFTSSSVTDNPDWSVDMSTSRTSDSSGSLKVVAVGRPKALRSGASPTDVISVGSGQTLTLSIYVINQGYVGSGTDAPVQLQVAPYTASGLGSFVTIDTYTPSGDITAWSDAHELTGTYAVPAGVTGVQARLLLTATAQAGTFHFDDGTLQQSAAIPQSFVGGLVGTLQGILSQIQAFIDTIVSALSGIPIIGGVLSDLDNALKSIESGNILGALGFPTIAGDVQGLVDTLISAFTGQPSSGGSVSDLHNAIVSSVTGTAGTDETFYYVGAPGSVAIPSWATYTDIVTVGGGQGGAQGEIFGLNGNPGAPGKFAALTLALGTDYSAGDTLTYAPGAAGAANGGVGTASTASVGTHTVSAAAGDISESVAWLGGVAGPGPGTLPYNGQNYVGGSTQSQHGQPGLSPGGAGAGGNGDLFQHGGAGAPGAVWVRFRANAVAGQSSGGDITAPTAPTPSVVSATNTSIIFSATGSVDS